MFADAVITPTVDFLYELAGNGKVLEFAVGTGRLAVPLMQRGISVTGIDFSPAMVSVLREKVGVDELPVIIGDMSEARAGEGYALVYLVYNTISNLLTQQAQVRCFENAAHHLVPGGRFVVELWVPELRKLPPGQQAVVWKVKDGHIGLDTYDVFNQTVVSHHFTYGAEDGAASINRSKHRYIWPAELDLMAQIAGFRLENRYADFSKNPFTPDDRSHVSVYIKESR